MRPHHLLMLAPLLVVVLGAKPEKEAKASDPERVVIVIAMRDMAAGERVTWEDVAQILVPREWVTTSYVKPDSVSFIIEQQVLLPVMKGDVLTWSLFETSKSPISASCAKATGQPATAAEQVARSRQVLLERPKQVATPEH